MFTWIMKKSEISTSTPGHKKYYIDVKGEKTIETQNGVLRRKSLLNEVFSVVKKLMEHEMRETGKFFECSFLAISGNCFLDSM